MQKCKFSIGVTAHVRLTVKLKLPSRWDSGCSHHEMVNPRGGSRKKEGGGGGALSYAWIGIDITWRP